MVAPSEVESLANSISFVNAITASGNASITCQMACRCAPDVRENGNRPTFRQLRCDGVRIRRTTSMVTISVHAAPSARGSIEPVSSETAAPAKVAQRPTRYHSVFDRRGIRDLRKFR